MLVQQALGNAHVSQLPSFRGILPFSSYTDRGGVLSAARIADSPVELFNDADNWPPPELLNQNSWGWGQDKCVFFLIDFSF